jgi:hypothetical protein
VYRVFVSGDEDATDDLSTGIKSRTVFDTVKGANLGTADATFGGSYTGTGSSTTIRVTISTAGELSTAKFKWNRGSDPSTLFGPYKVNYGSIALGDGVEILFGDGTYVVGDTFTAVVKEAVVYTGNLIWPFTTGSGSIDTLPSTVSTSVTGAPATPTTATTTFSVSSTSPANRATHLDSIVDEDFDIDIVFSTNVDASTATDANIAVFSEPVNGDDSTITASGIVAKSIAVSGDTVTLTVASGIIHENNIVTVTLDDNITSSGGTALSSDYEFYFTSTYYPHYSSVRKVRLEYGAFISDIPDDTVNLAIFEASLTVDNITWATATNNSLEDYYEWARWEFTTCKAAETLLLNILGISRGLKSKRLGDLEVQYDTAVTENGLEKALGCMSKWEATINGRGQGKILPQAVIKGSLDVDRPPIGRGWTPPDRKLPLATAKSRATNKRRWTSGYYNPSKGRSGKGNTHY